MNSIDRLGDINAQIASLEAEAKQIKASLIADIGAGFKADGDRYSVNVVASTRETLDLEKVRRFLHPNQLRAATKVAEQVSVRVSVKKSLAA